MAKKTLTPEQAEIKAIKKAKQSENWTKFLAILLAAVLTFGVVFLGKTQADNAIAKADASINSEADVDNDVDSSEEEGDMFGGNDSSNNDVSDNTSNNDATNNDANNNTSNNDTSSNTNNNSNNNTNNNNTSNNKPQQTGPSTAEVIKIFNEETAKAANGSYKIYRTGEFTKDIDVGSLTSFLDGVIKGVDENASINSVVGGFLGIGKPIEAVVTNGAGEGFDGKYMIKPMTLTEADVQGSKVEGNKYMIQVKKTVTPDENSALAHATNDYITFAQVNESIAGAVGSAVSVDPSGSKATYSSILFTATIVDGKMTNLEYSYNFSASLKIKVVIGSAVGTGAAKINCVYSDIKY